MLIQKFTAAGGMIAILALPMSSCSFLDIKGSIDSHKTKEGGQSATVPGDALGGNVAMEWVFGLDNTGTAPLKFNLPDDDDRGDYQIGQTEVAKADALNFAPQQAVSGFLVSTSLQFVQKGSKGDGFTSHLNYLEGTADLLYAHRFEDRGILFGGLGPYLAYGIGGKTGNGFGEISSFTSDGGYKRFDAGLNLKAGYKLPIGLYFTLEYDLGLYDNSGDPADYTSRNRNISLSVGYPVNKIIKAFKKK